MKSTREKIPVIDTDIHNNLPSPESLHPYLSERWRKHQAMIGGRGHAGSNYPRGMPHAARHDAWPPSGLSPGADLAFMQEQLLDAWDFEYGVLNPLMGGSGLNLEYVAAIARAINDWQVEEWTTPEPRLKASIVVPYEDGELAAEEIHRRGEDPNFVQVLLIARTDEPLGRRKYWKLYEAATQYDLPIGIHFGGVGAGPITGAGAPSYYIEDHGGMPQAFQTQVISLVCEGVFERFPTLKFVLIEGGFAWFPPLMWRLDQNWKKLKEEVPDLKKLPSEYMKEHFWLSSQPVEEPPKREYFDLLLEQLNARERLMFATDYPHWDFDAPDRAFPTSLAPDVRRRIMADNARELYNL